MCLWIKEKEGKMNHPPSCRANPKQGPLGNDYTFENTQVL